MSRCFPFPPPGYEKKTTTDDLDLLKKEKQKEKKLKKEKKDKDKVKREGKEKREKDKSDGKHKEKKDKKEKNRDKKKDKDKDRDKDRGSNLYEKRLPGHSEGLNGEKISADKRFPGQSESHNGEKLSNEKRSAGQSESQNGEKLSNEKRSAGRSEGHNGERASYEGRLPLLSESHSGEKFQPKKKDKQRNNFSNERRSSEQFAGYNGEKASRSIHLAENTQDSEFAQELGRRVRDESRGTENHFVDKFTVSDQKRDEEMLNPVAKATVNGAGGNANKDKGGNDRKIDGQGVRVDTRFSGNSMVQNFTEVAETRVEGSARPLGTNIEREMEGKEKTKEKGGNDRKIVGRGIVVDTRFSGDSMVGNFTEVLETKVEGIARPLGTKDERKMEGKEKNKDKRGDDKRKDTHKDRDSEKKRQGKDRDRDKERKKEEKKKAKEKKENKSMDRDQVKESIQNVIGTHDVKAPYLSHDSNTNSVSEENLRKRKDTETNGYLHANESRPNKLARPTLSSNSMLKNGRILDPSLTLIPINSERQDAATNLKVDSKNQKVNGAIETQPASLTIEAQTATLTKPPLGAAQADPIAEASKRAPHPDSKYLSQILSVPKIEDMSDFGEQDWLFSSSSDSLSKKCKLQSYREDETPMVWSQALQIESADVYALPYVIPY